MSKYYNAKRTRYIFEPDSKKPFKVSRTKLELFLDCPRCFYIDLRRGVKRPPGYPFTLNAAVDTLLKKEFDIHRAKGEPHPLMENYNIEAVPFQHDDLDIWRENFVGVQFLHEPTNLLIFGAVDDVWQNKKGELIVVDYKATSTTKKVSLDDEYRQAYKRQMEVYQWLLRQNGHKVNDTGYFVYCNGRADAEAFDSHLEFDVDVLPYKGDAKWVESCITDAHQCLIGDNIPNSDDDCDYCAYTDAIAGENYI
ncbi:hypothetical protein CL622_05860 [archaeon]|nr:hypothetical protein [archaeon]